MQQKTIQCSIKDKVGKYFLDIFIYSYAFCLHISDLFVTPVFIQGGTRLLRGEHRGETKKHGEAVDIIPKMKSEQTQQSPWWC